MIQASTQDNREQFSAVHRILNERGPDHYSVKAHNEQVERELSLLLKQRSLAQFCEDMAALRSRADVVIASHHWGLDHEVLDYQVEIARTAIDVGADLVMGHGPHMPLGIELYKDKPIFYVVGSFSFETGHRGRTHPDWIGLMLHVAVEDAESCVLPFPLSDTTPGTKRSPVPSLRRRQRWTNYVASRHALAPRFRSRATKW
jgi:hypothetical protein